MSGMRGRHWSQEPPQGRNQADYESKPVSTVEWFDAHYDNAERAALAAKNDRRKTRTRGGKQHWTGKVQGNNRRAHAPNHCNLERDERKENRPRFNLLKKIAPRLPGRRAMFAREGGADSFS
jgi:hypothetical protein